MLGLKSCVCVCEGAEWGCGLVPQLNLGAERIKDKCRGGLERIDIMHACGQKGRRVRSFTF